ncbi:receptor-type tyrosine-protein phosphatase zeta isoform 1 precursor [Rattus norvegicus]|uniref:Receptor-type tyrosine-protein phosphatase zeta n=1 Tax=Rattus norvegicus TaxID=10116 RepID=F1LMY3_RAT|nr:receptor-type tyrosine-protein phosphatase zeta isoform 1 precursor [Rattus norvegicus]|eukprot:NP_037212.2 receptor-type tyrosine-protein phosphatase zeta isoform 1 precursor [Rattus norvegicus]
MRILQSFLACVQLLCVCRLDWAYGYYRQQRKLVEEIGWSYTGALNQKNWGKKYPICNSPKQSPINIDEDLTQVNVNLKKLKFQGWEKPSLENTFIHNTGKTVEINLTNDYYLSGGLSEKVFKASKMTFHWGKCNVSSEGSEHSLEGQKFPLEMQIYCFDADRFSSFEETVKGKGRLRALSILFEIGVEENLDYKAIIDGTESVSRFGKQAALDPFILQNLLPNSTDKYYIYNGSLTSPPCTDTVEWIVFKDTVSISESQLAVFCEVLTMQQSGYVMLMDYLQNNFREQQYKFSRQVFSSYTGKEEIHEAVCSSEPENVQADPENYTSLLITWERPRVVYDTMIEKFAVLYQPLEGNDQTKHEFLTDGYQDLGAILNNLIPNMSYVLQIVAICSNGLYGKYSDQLIVDMPTEDAELDLFPELIGTEEIIKEEDYGKGNEEDTGLNPGRDSATNQIRKKEPQVSTTTHYNHMGTKYNEAKTNRSPTKGSEFSGKSDVLNTSLNPTSQQVAEFNPEREMSLPSQIGTNLPPHSVEGTSASLNSGSKTLLVFPQMNLSGTAESLNMVSITEYKEVSADLSEEENLLTDFKLDSGADDSSGSSPASSTVPFSTDNLSHGYTSSSDTPEAVTYDVLRPESTRNALEDSAPSGSEESLKDPSLEGSVWFPGSTDLTTQSETGSGREGFLQVNSTDFQVDESRETTETFSPDATASRGPSVTDMEMPHYSTFAYPPTEVTPHAFTPSSRPLDLAPTSNILHSQTTQPVYNGETPLQPSYSSEVFPLVTPLLLDNQTLNTTPAASSSDSALHATPVFPSVGVSFDSILSSYDDAPLLPFSSASFSSDLFHHLHTVSQTLPQVTSAAERDELSLHASLLVAGGDLLLEPSLVQYSDVMSHQVTIHAASDTLEFGSESAVLYKTSMVSQIESPSSDVVMHAYSSGPETSYAIEGSHHVLTVSSSSAIPVHDSIGVADQGSLLINPSHISLPESSFITPTASLLQLPPALSGDGEWSGASSDSELLLPDTDGLRTLNMSSPVSVADFTYTTSVSGDDIKPLSKGEMMYGNETELKMSSFSDMAYPSKSTVVPKMSDIVNKWSESLKETSVSVSSINSVFTESLVYPITKVFDQEISRVPEIIFPVKPTHTASQASGDTWLKPGLSTNSEPALSDTASSEVLHPSTQPLLYEAASPFNTEALLQPSFPASDVDTLLKTALPSGPRDPVLTETPMVEQSSSSMSLPLASESASSKSTLHFTSVPVLNMSPSDVHPTSLQRLTVPHSREEYFEQGLLKSKSPQQVLPSLHSHDEFFQTAHLDISQAYPPKGRHAFATPILSIDEPQNTLISRLVYSEDIFMHPEISITDKALTGLPTTVSDVLIATDHSVPLGSGPISMTTVSPNRDDSVTTTKLLLPSKATSKPTHSARSDADLVGGGEDGDDYDDDDYDDIDSDRFPVNKCMSCSPYRESQEKVMNDSDTQESSLVDQSDPISHLLSENTEEENGGTGVTRVDKSPDKSPPPSMLPQKHNDGREDRDIQMGSAVLPHTPGSKAWAVLTSDEESGSGQGTSDSLNDNETSTDFSFPDVNEKDADGVLEADDTGIAPGSPRSSTPSVTSGHSGVSNSSEAEASNSSHESRIGLAEGLESEKKAVIPLVIVSALTFICLVVLVGILIYWRKCFQTAHFYLEDNTSPRVISTPPTPIFPISDDIGAIPIKHFPKHVADLHASNGFTEEFETLKEFYQEVQSCTVDLGITADSSNHPDNKHKNRYVNIVAYDHSRVKLTQLAEKDGKLTDYINANYVDGYNRPKAYIAAQGPLKSTAEDFWRMIWEHNVEVIVMITNLVEKGRRKCDQYWPTDGSEEYGSFLVNQKNVQVLAYYTVRNFTLRNTKIKKGSQKGRSSGRLVTQYHYTQWPDMGVPEYSLPVLAFVRKTAQAKRHAVGPVVVHCSAGVGRTGTYIVLDSMLQQIQHEGTVNIFGFLKHIRSQRNYLVQTEEQYVFIHDTLVEAILSKETEVPDSHIHSYVNTLLIPGPSGKTKLEKQFQLLSQSNILQSDYSTALKQCNREKNRTSSIIPVERSRVGISSLSGEGTDYINASYIMGYYQSNEFIITQHPLLHTIKDFWRMIWDHNAQLVVMIPDGQNMAEDEFVYWPNKDEPINCESFKVTLMSEEHKCLSNEEKLIVQDFILEATQDDYVLEVRHFQCPKWPNPDSPISKTFELISIIKEEAANRDGPMIVHDEHGGVTAGTFCALTTLMHQLEKENSMDVYQVAKMINLMRPGVFTDIEQYQFLYKVVLSLVSTRQEENPSTSLDSNGAALPDGNIAESLESLV